MSDVTILPKGGSLTLRGKDAVRKAVVGLGWDPQTGQSKGAKFDLDASIVFRDASGKSVSVCYYANQEIGDWVKHSGDNLTGDGEGDDETINLTLNKVPAEIAFADVVVHIYDGKNRNQYFGKVDNAYVRLVDQENDDREIVRYDLTNEQESFDNVGIHIARLTRQGPTWSFDIPKKHFDPQYSDLQSFSRTLLPSIA